MSSKYGLLSFLVFCGVLFLAFKNYEIWTQPIELAPEKSTTKKSEIKSENKSEVPAAIGTQKDPFSLKSYISISEKNIFSPERKDFPIQPSPEMKKPMVRPQIVLYGLTIFGDYQSASVVNPGRPLRKGERETLTIRIGEKIGEYKLAKVLPDRIMLENTNDSFEVLLYDPRAPKKRMEARTETKPPAAAVGPSSVPPASLAPQAAAPAIAPPPASVEKPKEPAQQQVSPPPPTSTPKPIPPLWQRRRGIPSYPPTSPPTGVPGKATQQEK